MNDIKKDKIQLEFINLFTFIKLMIKNVERNENIQIKIIYCLMNLIKLFHEIIFNDKLISFFSENKFLLTFKCMLG